jgi:hypothetical protein
MDAVFAEGFPTIVDIEVSQMGISMCFRMMAQFEKQSRDLDTTFFVPSPCPRKI